MKQRVLAGLRRYACRCGRLRWGTGLSHYVLSQPSRLASSSIPQQNCSHRVNDVCNGSPSRIRMVRRISFGMTTRPRSSIRRTIPVAFIYISPLALFSFLLSAKMQKICGSKESQTNICTGQSLKFCREQGSFSPKYTGAVVKRRQLILIALRQGAALLTLISR